MPKVEIKVNSILGGIAPSPYFTGEGQFDASIAIDPDFPITDTGGQAIRTSGALRPVAFAAFDGANVNSGVYWAMTNPKDALVYFYLGNGRLISYNSSLAGETLAATATSSSGNGAVYYNNYLYLFTNTDVSRYGPLDGTPALTNSVWTGSTLGTQTALVNTTYPTTGSARGGAYSNHVAFVHSDNKLYFCDFDSTSSTAATRNRGLIHFIRTTFSTTEGTGNDGSTYNALDLPLGFKPTCLGNWGLDLVIGAFQGTNATLDQGHSALFFWDTTSASFYRQVSLPDPFVSAILNNNGILYIWAGKFSSTGGYSLYRYIGGDSVQEIAAFEEGHPPMAGAVDALGDRVIWGSWQTYPDNAACVWSWGSKDRRLPGALHNIARSTATASSTAGMVTCVKYVEQRSNALPAPVIGWNDATVQGIDSLSTTYQSSFWRSQRYSLGKRGIVKKIIYQLGAALAANMTIVPTIFIDDANTSTALTTINSTNYSGRRVIQQANVPFNDNFLLQLNWTGTALCPITLPIVIEVETQEP